MTARALALVLVAGCATDPDVSVATSSLSVERINYPGAIATRILGNNNLGHYVGLFSDGRPHAMAFDGQALVALDPGGVVGTAPRSRAYATNDRGDIVGSYSDAAGGLHGFLLRDGVVTTIDSPDGAPTEVYGINDRGVMIGVTYADDGTAHGFRLWQGTFTDLDIEGSTSTVPLSIDDRGRIVGETIVTEGTIGHGFMRAPHGCITTYDAPEAPPDSTYFVSINNRGQILGAYFDEAFATHNFVLTGETLVPFEPGLGDVTVQTINDHGDIVGYFRDATGFHGFIARD